MNELKNIINETFINYKGRIIERRANDFRVGKDDYSSIEEARTAIDKSFKELGALILSQSHKQSQ